MKTGCTKWEEQAGEGAGEGAGEEGLLYKLGSAFAPLGRSIFFSSGSITPAVAPEFIPYTVLVLRNIGGSLPGLHEINRS